MGIHCVVSNRLYLEKKHTSALVVTAKMHILASLDSPNIRSDVPFQNVMKLSDFSLMSFVWLLV